ncbi:MAG: cytochrome c oxidase subunit II [Rhodobacteraceae bacterium]|nr:MAG: cytochrome c oxidase subunit II [Paracoccaceae bacterium]
MRSVLFLAVVLTAGCAGPLSTLDPAGPVAGQIAWLWWAMLAGAGVLTLLVLVLVAMGFGGLRPVAARVWTHRLGLWFSLGVLSVTLGAGLWVGERILPRGDAVEVTAHSFQWGWRFGHPDGMGGWIAAEGVLHIPAGEPVDVVVTSADVIHAFWVPRLAGKIDAIPGRENRLRLQADAPGIYAGRSAEFSGVGYAGMTFTVIAHAPDDWPAAIAALRDEAPDD